MLAKSNARIKTVQDQYQWSDGSVRSYPEPVKK